LHPGEESSVVVSVMVRDRIDIPEGQGAIGVELLRTKNPNVKIVLSVIALETLNEAMKVLEDIDITSISVAKAKEVGNYHMMTGQNPIYIISTKG
jgi:precorrin-6B methylase 2